MSTEHNPLHPRDAFATEFRTIVNRIGGIKGFLTQLRHVEELKSKRLFMKPERVGELMKPADSEAKHDKVRPPSNTEMLGILAIARIYCSDDPQIGDRLAASLVAWQTFKSENPTGKKPKPVNHPEEALFVFTQAVPGKTYGMSIINPVLDLMPGYPGAEVIRQMCAIYDDKPRMELITPAELQGDDRMPPENTLNDRLFMSARTRLSAYHPMVGVLFAEVFSVPLNISAEALPGIRLNTALVFARDPVRSMTDEERIETYQRTVRINANFGNMVGKRSGSDDLPPRNG